MAIRKRGSAWRQVAGDYGNPLLFGGTFIRDDPGSAYCDLYIIEGSDLSEETHKVEVMRAKKKGVLGPDAYVFYKLTVPAPLTVYRIDSKYSDPLNASWVKWADVMRCLGDTRKPAELEPWQRIMLVGDYYGYANFGEPDELRTCDVARTLRSALRKGR